MKVQTICVLGGTGFVGGHLVRRLFNSGRKVKVLTRHRERHRELLVMPTVELVEADVRDAAVLEREFAGMDAVINLIGILNGDEATFRAVHAELPARVALSCKQAGVKRLLQMSALDADPVDAPSLYLRSKGEGEAAVHQAARDGLRVTSFRPSIIFGPDDSFFNRFAGLLKLSPVLPLACPNTRFSPVFVDDVADAFELSLENEATFGQRLELCGPKTYTLKELVEYTARMIGRKRLVVGLPDSLARLQGQILQHVPGQPFTMDNYRSLQVDSVCHTNALPALGITPHSVESVMPRHLGGGGRGGPYSRFRRGARR